MFTILFKFGSNEVSLYLQASYSPRSVTLTSSEYEKHVELCSTPLPSQFSVKTVKTIVEDKDGYTKLRCAIPNIDIVYEYRLTVISETGVYTFVHEGVSYMVTIVRETLVITVQTVVVTNYKKQTVVYALDKRSNLCTAWYDVNQRNVELTQVTRSVRILQLFVSIVFFRSVSLII